jgi:hypothetical protein
MVDLDLGREVPALRRAFIFAYRPRLAIYFFFLGIVLPIIFFLVIGFFILPLP